MSQRAMSGVNNQTVKEGKVMTYKNALVSPLRLERVQQPHAELEATQQRHMPPITQTTMKWTMRSSMVIYFCSAPRP